MTAWGIWILTYSYALILSCVPWRASHWAGCRLQGIAAFEELWNLSLELLLVHWCFLSHQCFGHVQMHEMDVISRDNDCCKASESEVPIWGIESIHSLGWRGFKGHCRAGTPPTRLSKALSSLALNTSSICSLSGKPVPFSY